MYKYSNKRKAQAENTKWNIYVNARRLFNEKGFYNVTMDEIAENSGVSVGTIYYYYKNKKEIIADYHQELDSAYSQYYHDVILAPGFEDKSTIEKLLQTIIFICETTAGQGLENIRIVYPYMMRNEDFSAKVMHKDRPYMRILHHLFSEAQAKGDVGADVGIAQLISETTMLVRGCLIEWCIAGGGPDVRSFCYHLINTYLQGLTLAKHS